MKTWWKIRRPSSFLFPSPCFLLCCPLSFTFCSVFPFVSFASLFLLSSALSFFFVFVCSRGGATRDKAGACALAGQRFSLFLSSPVPLFFFCVLPLFIHVRSRFSSSFFFFLSPVLLFPFLVLCPVFSIQDEDNGGKSTRCCWLMDQNFPLVLFLSVPPLSLTPSFVFVFPPGSVTPSRGSFIVSSPPAFFVCSGFIATEFHRYQVINRLLLQE